MVNLKRYKITLVVTAALCSLLALTPGTYSEAGGPYGLKKGAILVARPQLANPLFMESVVLIVRHSRSLGTLGLIINKPTGYSPRDFLSQLEEVDNLYEDLFIGGPVNKKIPTLLIHTATPPEGLEKIFGNVYFSGNLTAVLDDEEKKDDYEIRAYIGISSWAPGQLEAEIRRGDWLVVEADSKMVFSKEPEKIWEKLLAKGGRGSSFLLEVNNLHPSSNYL